MNEFEIFETARNLATAAEQDAFLAKACAGEPSVLARIKRRLQSGDTDLTSASSSSAHEPTRALSSDLAKVPSDDYGGETASTRIGDYRLVKRIGQGGMGSVWMAEQEQPVQRTVALKIIKAGMDTREVIARFEAERQALARMDHPNIAKVLDAGATDQGRPFFVMELVDGVPITSYCDSNHLPTEKRLELFCATCHAIQHAHQKGIIHRDIKPSNVLVSESAGRPTVKVIDFGLAKATDCRLTEKSLFTQLGQMIGTPTYMSPEQADAEIDIDTRTDVYSLGVLLYELMTGVTPLDMNSLRGAAYSEVQRMIRENEPPRMSNRLSTLGGESTIAAGNRATDSRKLVQMVRGDLDVIAMKALEKERNRRYETPDSFAADIQRYLNREIIEARPASTWYRLQKFWVRNRVAVATAALVVIALVGATIFSSWQAIRANKSAIAERAANAQAQKRLDQIEKGSDILGSIFKDIDLRQVEGDGKTLEQVLGERLKGASAQLTDEAVGDSHVMAKLQSLLGESLYSLGYMNEASDLFEKAGRIYLSLLGPDDPKTLSCQHNLAECYVLAGKEDLAIDIHEKTLARSKAALGPTVLGVARLFAKKELGEPHQSVDPPHRPRT